MKWFADHGRALAALGAALALTGLYYVYGVERAGSYVFRIGDGGFLQPEDLECQFMFFYAIVGAYVVLFLTLFLHWSPKGVSPRALGRAIGCRKHSPLVITLAAFGAMLLVRFVLLERVSVTDDENAYLFLARTLLEGRLVNPAPEFHELFRNQFVHADPFVWFAQYPIGHALFLAGGLAVGAVDVMVPLCGFGTVWMTFLICKEAFDERTARIAVVLMALSPHFVLTSGTLLGYTTAAFASAFLVYAALCLYSFPQWRCFLVFTVASSLLLLNRPLSWACLGLALALYYVGSAIRNPSRNSLAAIVLMAGAASISLALFLFINLQQTGDSLLTVTQWYYQNSGQSLGLGFGAETLWEVHTPESGLANLLLSAARQNIWLFGWPFSFLFLAFAGKARFVSFLMIWFIVFYGAHVYVASPGVLVTGPNHYAEMVIPVALLSAHGIARLDHIVRRTIVTSSADEIVPSLVAALFLCSLVLFVPPAVGTLQNCVDKASRVYTLLDRKHVHHAIVFANKIVADHCNTFVFVPPTPGPNLEDADRIYVRWPANERRLEEFVGRYPDREVWGVLFNAKGEPMVVRKGSERFAQWRSLVTLRFPHLRECR